MSRWLQYLGSIRVAVPLLLGIAGVLAWGTIYETRFGTAAVQRFIYHAWWFQGILGFLAVNLAAAAVSRYPWQRRHLAFLLAHLGIILILIGGIIGAQWGIEGQLIIPEGQASATLDLPTKQVIIHQPNPGAQITIPARFETQVWRENPGVVVPLTIDGRPARVAVDRYYPDAALTESVRPGGSVDNPAIHVRLEQAGRPQDVWLVARDPRRSAVEWGETEILFVEARSASEIAVLAGRATATTSRGRVTFRRTDGAPLTVAVPYAMGRPQPLFGTPYAVTFKAYFPDFVINDTGPGTRSNAPNNPAVAFTLDGPEGQEAYLLFAFHPEISTMHGWAHRLPWQTTYTHPARRQVPPNSTGLARTPDGAFAAVMTGPAGTTSRTKPLKVGQWITHPRLPYRVQIAAFEPRAQITRAAARRSDRVREEALRVVGRQADAASETWLGLGDVTELPVGSERLLITYRKMQTTLPFTVALNEFRRQNYPGTQMAKSFEADVTLTDPARDVTIHRIISLNNPLKYRGYSLFQASFIDGPTETTVLAVRNDPGVPLVYLGFLIVVGGVVALFWRRPVPVGAWT